MNPRSSEPKPKPPGAYRVQEIRLEYPNAYRRWEPEEDAQLAQRSAEGASLAELVEEFGRQESAVQSRLAKIDATGPAADEARRMGL